MADAKYQIIVIKLGWVLVGTVVDERPDTLTIHGAHVIRRWGATKGLGELAAEGPTKNTTLEATGCVVIERDSVLFRIDCEVKPWKKTLG